MRFRHKTPTRCASEGPSNCEQMSITPSPHLPFLQPAAPLLRAFKKTISLVQSVAFTRRARNRPHYQNRAQKPKSDTLYSARNTRFLRAPHLWTPHISRNLIGKKRDPQKKPAEATSGDHTSASQPASPALRQSRMKKGQGH